MFTVHLKIAVAEGDHAFIANNSYSRITIPATGKKWREVSSLYKCYAISHEKQTSFRTTFKYF